MKYCKKTYKLGTSNTKTRVLNTQFLITLCISKGAFWRLMTPAAAQIKCSSQINSSTCCSCKKIYEMVFSFVIILKNLLDFGNLLSQNWEIFFTERNSIEIFRTKNTNVQYKLFTWWHKGRKCKNKVLQLRKKRIRGHYSFLYFFWGIKMSTTTY